MSQGENTIAMYTGQHVPEQRVASKRQYAFVLDYLLWAIVGRAVFSWSGFQAWVAAHFDDRAYSLIAVGTFLFWRVGLLCKDGAGGCSPGKWVFGLRVIKTVDDEPARLRDSINRNLVLLIPIIGELILWLSLRRGRRIGDSWAKCRVIEDFDED